MEVTATTRFQLRPLTSSTPGALYSRIQQAAWPFTEQDCAFVQDSPDVSVTGMYAVDEDGEKSSSSPTSSQLVGTITLSDNGGYTFIGMVTVSDAFRRRGLATQLMQQAIRQSHALYTQRKHSGGKDVVPPSTCRLTATTMGAPVYRRLGFVERGLALTMELRLSMLQGSFATMDGVQTDARRRCGGNVRIVSSTVAAASTLNGTSLVSHLWRIAVALDQEANGGDRARLLRDYLVATQGCVHFLYDSEETGDQSQVVPSSASLLAWCAVRPCSSTSRSIGPLIARTAHHASTLLALATHTQLHFEQQQQARPSILVAGSGSDKDTFVTFTDSAPTDAAAFLQEVYAQGYEETMPTTIMHYDVEAGAADAGGGSGGGVHAALDPNASTAPTDFDKDNRQRQSNVTGAQQYVYLDGALG